ncbi:chorismate mutase [Paucilactobacillus kaifaensis]|uniref:chorismate mutase n=1 Tax=Paucilactobacillus kaifaensis TaxID=2559921 RepID=UPI0010F95FF0|nr:chorismate mutase [Paucilactobacillus kaifaensis]
MNEVIDELRDQIDQCDDQIMKALDRRLEIVKQVAKYKEEHQLPIRQPKRMTELTDRLIKQYSNDNLSPVLIKKLYQLIMDYAIELEQK